MEIRVDKLREALKLIQPVINKKSKLVPLTYVLLDDGKVIGTDLEAAVVVRVPEVDERCVLPHNQVMELLKYIPGTDTITIKQEKKTVALKWLDGDGEGSYDVIDADEYPELPEIESLIDGSVDGDLLTKSLSAVVPFTTAEESRPVLSGVLMDIEEETITTVAADGFRLACLTLPMSLSGTKQAIIPADSVGVLQSVWKGCPGNVQGGDNLMSQIIGRRMMFLSMNENHLSAKFGTVEVITKLIQGTFPDYRPLIPQDPPQTVQFFSSDLLRALQGANKMAADNNGIIRLMWGDGKMKVAAKYGNNNFATSINALSEGGEGKIGVNISYLLSYLKDKDGFVTMRAINPSSPMVLEYNQAPVIVLMPMAVTWGDETPAPENEADPVDGETNEASAETVSPDSATKDQGDEGKEVAQVDGKGKGRRKKG